MAVASVARVGVQALVPRGLDDAAVGRLRAAVGRPLVEAVPDAFGMLEEVDAGACWLLRAVRVDVRVPASEPDPARHAARIARAMAAAVERIVHEGPSADAVRYAGRPEYVAAYVAAVLDGRTGTWVFDRFRALAGLRPTEALVAAAQHAGTDVLDVVAALATDGCWPRLLDRSTHGEAARLAEVVGRLRAPTAGEAVLAEARSLRSLATNGAGPGPLARAVERRLRLLGEVIRTGAVAGEAVTAAWLVEPAAGDVSGREVPGESPHVAEPQVEPSRPDVQEEHEDAVPVAKWEVISMGDRMTAVGAPAFLLAPDLDDLVPHEGPGSAFAGATRAAGEARALLLAAVLGRESSADDPAVRLAAGAEPRQREQDTTEVQALLDASAGWLDDLAADETFGWEHPADAEWLAPVGTVDPRLTLVARAVLRRFAAHLPGFGRSGAGYLAERVLPLGGTIRLDEDAVVVELPRPQLHVLLALADLDAFTYHCRWLDVPVVVVHEAD